MERRYVLETWGKQGVLDANASLKQNVLLFKPFREPKDPTAHIATFIYLHDYEAVKVWESAEFYGTFSITPATRL